MNPATKHTDLVRRKPSGQQAQREYLSDSDDLLYAWLVRHKDKPGTYRVYERAVRDFFGTDRVTLDMARAVSDEMINNYITGLTNQRTGEPASAKTKAKTLSAIRGFYEWLKRKRLLAGEDNPFSGDVYSVKVNRGENPVIYLSADQVRAMLRATDDHGEAAIRDYTIVYMLVHLMLRRSELAAVRCEHFTTQGVYNVLMIPRSKGGENQSVKVPAHVLESVERHRAQYGIEAGPLFLSTSNFNRDEPIGPDAIYRVIKRAALAAGLPDHVAVHTLRHTGATLALDGGAAIHQVKGHLRHKNIETTMIYLHQRDKLADSAVDYIHI